MGLLYLLYREYKELYLVSCIKFKSLEWAGHVLKLPLDRIRKKVLKSEFTGNGTVGRPRFEWEECVKEGAAKLLRCRNWKLTARNRTFWRQKLWQVKARLRTVVP
jgi:hypothetical protein